jgi:hypothetical protein
MSNTEDEKAREERALDALIAAAFKDDPSEVDDKEIERYGNALTDDDRKKLDAAGKNLIDSLFSGETKKPKEQAPQTFSTAMNRGDEGVALTDRASEEKERRIQEARERRKALARNKKIQEHDMVRVRANLQVEGYSLRAGMIGTVVSVYRNGEAFAVEFPELERGSAVVTLYRDQIEPAEGTDE